MNRKFIEIPFHEDYGITSYGNVIEFKTSNQINPYKKKEKYYFRLDNEEIEAGKIILITFIGDFPSDIKYKYGYDNYDVGSVCYDISDFQNHGENIVIQDVIFKPTKRYPNYFISEDGIIYSSYYRKFLVRSFNHRGYPTIGLVDINGHRSPRKVHRVVYETFIGDLNDGMVIDHKNGKKWCSSYWNLEQVTQRENIKRSYENGQNPLNHWSDSQINTICKMIEDRCLITDMLRKLNLDDTMYKKLSMIIHLIRKKGYFKEISNNYKIDGYPGYLNKRSRVLDPSDIISIRKELSSNDFTIKQISEKYNCSTDTVAKIRDNKTWKTMSSEFNE